MEINASLRTILETGLGILYMVGAGFNFAYTLENGEKFYAAFAKGTWFTPASWFIHRFVLPRPRIFTAVLILFQVFLGVVLLSQGVYTKLGLLAGVVFCMYAVFASNLAGAIANLALVVLQFYLVIAS